MSDQLGEGLGGDDLAAVEISPKEEDVDQHARDAGEQLDAHDEETEHGRGIGAADVGSDMGRNQHRDHRHDAHADIDPGRRGWKLIQVKIPNATAEPKI